MEKLLTMTDAAALLGIKVSQLYKLVSSEQISVVKVGGSNRFKPKDIEKYIKEHTITAKPIGY